MIKRFCIGILLCFFFILLETQLLSNLFFLPVMPDFVLITLLFLSIKNGALFGEVSGFSCGLLTDVLSLAPLGFNALVNTVISFIVGCFKNVLIPDKFFIPAVLGFTATVCKALLLLLIQFIFPIQLPGGSILSGVFVGELILNTVLTPFMFRFLGLFSPFICDAEEIER